MDLKTALPPEGTVAIGMYSEATNKHSVAIGYDAQALAEISVALGVGSIANEEHTLAVGGRRVTDIGEPLMGTDAVIFSRVQELESRLEMALHEIALIKEKVELLNSHPSFISPGHQKK